jgi:hypothetical protein
MWLSDLLAAVRRGDEAGHNAAITLGLLIEREFVAADARDSRWDQILDEKWTQYRLSPEQIKTVKDELIKYVREKELPEPASVWTLSKFHQEDALDSLIELLDRTLMDKHSESVAREALTAITRFRGEKALTAIQRALQSVHIEVRASAHSYLETFFPKLL